MATIYEVHFGVLAKGELPAEISEIGSDWQNTLKGKRSKVITNLSRVIADEADYKDKIVNRSNAGYQDFLGAGHPRLTEIMLKRKIKMDAAASEYIENRNAAFAEDGAFEEGIDRSADIFLNNVKVILRIVGDRDKIFGAIPKLKYALEGKKALLEEILDSTRDHLITSTDLKPFFISNRFVPAVIAVVNKWLSYVVYAIDANYEDSWIETNIAAIANDELAALVNSAMVNPELDPAACSITIEKDSTTGRWGIKLVEATPEA